MKTVRSKLIIFTAAVALVVAAAGIGLSLRGVFASSGSVFPPAESGEAAETPPVPPAPDKPEEIIKNEYPVPTEKTVYGSLNRVGSSESDEILQSHSVGNSLYLLFRSEKNDRDSGGFGVNAAKIDKSGAVVSSVFLGGGKFLASKPVWNGIAVCLSGGETKNTLIFMDFNLKISAEKSAPPSDKPLLYFYKDRLFYIAARDGILSLTAFGEDFSAAVRSTSFAAAQPNYTTAAQPISFGTIQSNRSNAAQSIPFGTIPPNRLTSTQSIPFDIIPFDTIPPNRLNAAQSIPFGTIQSNLSASTQPASPVSAQSSVSVPADCSVLSAFGASDLKIILTSAAAFYVYSYADGSLSKISEGIGGAETVIPKKDGYAIIGKNSGIIRLYDANFVKTGEKILDGSITGIEKTVFGCVVTSKTESGSAVFFLCPHFDVLLTKRFSENLTVKNAGGSPVFFSISDDRLNLYTLSDFEIGRFLTAAVNSPSSVDITNGFLNDPANGNIIITLNASRISPLSSYGKNDVFILML
ncbi:MAG: hypothetical protein LBP62_00590 [Clostridiales bacterium]|jgi:hypothetical protein|nr:hypothetical protein [Clostridiales bacterium]